MTTVHITDEDQYTPDIRQIHAYHISWQALLKLAIFCGAIIAFIVGLGDTPAQSAAYFVNTYEPAIATSDDALNLYIANLVIEVSQSNGNIAYFAGAAMFILITIMLYWMTISFNLARAADPLLRKIPFFNTRTIPSHRSPRQDPFNISAARNLAQAVPTLRYVVAVANRYHNSFHPGDTRKIIKIILFSVATGILIAGTGDMLFNAADYDIRNQGSHNWTIHLANLKDASANLALLAGSSAFIAIVAIRVSYFLFIKLVYFSVFATFGIMLAVANSLQTDHDKWTAYQLELNQMENQDIPNLPETPEPAPHDNAR